MAKILVRRGTKTQLDGILLDSGEIGFTTDTRECFVGDGSGNFLVGRVLVGTIAARPAAGVSGRLYEATDEGKTYLDNGTVWKLVGVATLDDVPDGSVYGKVLNTELESGQVKQVRAVTGGVNVTGDQLNTHLTDADVHRTINDAGTAATDLWSADKIDTEKADKVGAAVAGNVAGLDASGNLLDSGLKKNDAGTGTNDLWSANQISNAISNTASGLAWQDPVKVLRIISDASFGGTPPTGLNKGDAFVANNWGGGYTDNRIYEWDGAAFVDMGALSAGDRVIVTDASAAGGFAGQEEKIGEYDGTWTFTSPAEGWAVLVTGDGGVFENNGYTYSNAAWIQFTGAGQINAGAGLIKDGNTIDVQLGAGIAQLPTDEVGVDVVANDGLRLTGIDTAGQLTVDYDNDTIGIVANKLAIKANGIGADQIDPAIAGDGIAGGGGSPLSIVEGNGVTVTADGVEAKVAPNEGLVVDATGLKASYDSSSIGVNGSGQLEVTTVDGGSF